jgi:predicted DNA-binding transcriptional regulator AlpA
MAGDRAAREDALSRKQLCARLNIERTTLWRRIKDGHFPDADVVVGGRPAWSVQAVEEWERREGMTRAQVCARFGVTPRALYNWLQSGFFPLPDTRVKGRKAWSAQAVQAWLDEKDAEARLRHQEREFERRNEERRRQIEAQRRKESAAWFAKLTAEHLALCDNRAPPSEADAYAMCDWAR